MGFLLILMRADNGSCLAPLGQGGAARVFFPLKGNWHSFDHRTGFLICKPT
jgi:hypothetical protein